MTDISVIEQQEQAETEDSPVSSEIGKETPTSKFQKARFRTLGLVKKAQGEIVRIKQYSPHIDEESQRVAEISEQLEKLTADTAERLGVTGEIKEDMGEDQQREAAEDKKDTNSQESENFSEHSAEELRDTFQADIKNVCHELGLDASEYAEKIASDEEMRRVVDEHLDSKLKQILDKGGGYIKNTELSDYQVKPGLIDKAMVITAKRVLHMRGVSDASAIVDEITGQRLPGYQELTKPEIIENLKKLTVDEVRRGKARMEQLGFTFYLGYLESGEFVESLKTLSQHDDETMQKIYDELDPYFFLHKTSGQIMVPETNTLNTEFRTLTKIISNGGINEPQKAALDKMLRFALMDSGNSFIAGENGNYQYSWTSNIGDVLEKAVPPELMDSAEPLVMQELYRSLTADISPHEGKEVPFHSISALLNMDKTISLKHLNRLNNFGIDGFALIRNIGYFTADKQHVEIEKAQKMIDISENSEQIAWLTIVDRSLNGFDKLDYSRVDEYEKLLGSRDSIDALLMLNNRIPPENKELLLYYGREQIVNPSEYSPIRLQEIMKKIPSHELYGTDHDLYRIISAVNWIGREEHIDKYRKYETFDIHVLPLAKFLLQEKDNFSEYYDDQNRPTEKMVEMVLTGQFSHNESIVKGFIKTNWEVFNDQQLLQLVPHTHLIPSYRVPLFARNLPEEILTSTEYSPTIIQYLTAIRAASHELQGIYSRYFGEDFYQDGKPTRTFFQEIVKEKDIPSLKIALSDEEISASFTPSEQGIIRYWQELESDLKQYVIDNAANFPFLEEGEIEKVKKTGEVMKLVHQSPSKEIKRLEKELSAQLWEVDDPAAVFAQIEDIFIKNNLPLVGKVYRVFETIYDLPKNGGNSLLEEKLSRSEKLSPQLREADAKKRRELIYHDLLRVHVESGNPSLRKFIVTVQEGQQLVDRVMSGQGTFTEDEQQQLTYFLNKMDTLYINSLLGRTVEARKRKNDPENYKAPTTSELPIPERITALTKNLRVRDGQKMSDRLIEMFATPLGIESLSGVLDEMEKSKSEADARNRELAIRAATKGGIINVESGDLFKGVNRHFIANILENGSVAKEFLGSSADSDSTPFDTDVSIVKEEDIGQTVEDALEKSPSRSDYGNLIFIIKNRGQFEGDDGYEFFHTGVIGERHYGIRTGFASTEIDAMIDMQEDTREQQSLFLSIARNGFYIPVVDKKGKVIFTPDLYAKYRRTFDGVAEFDGQNIEVTPVRETQNISPEVVESAGQSIAALIPQIQEGEASVNQKREKVRSVIREVLNTSGVNLRSLYDTSIFGAEFEDTGSTGRGTNIPGDLDFDLSLMLDANDSPRRGEIAEKIKAALNPEEDQSHVEPDREYTQIRAIRSRIADEEPMDIDLGISRRSDSEILASHDAVKAKLDSVRENYGEETYYQVLANIVLAKQILKEAHAYKKGVDGDGGIGGIGVENWIIANNGNLLEAFRSFYEAAHENGNIKSLEQFKSTYTVFDAGTNIKRQGEIENHIAKLTESGYKAMLAAISSYLSTGTISSVDQATN